MAATFTPNNFFDYLQNCFMLLLPVFFWNIVFANDLPLAFQPENFDFGIPVWVESMEITLRLFVFGMPCLMLFSSKTKIQKAGWAIYFIGLLLYFGSWGMQLWMSNSSWSQSIWGVMAPAYTTLIWLLGIALVGTRNFLKIPYFSWAYLAVLLAFVSVHSYHAYLAFQNL